MHLLKLLAVFYRTSVQTDVEYRADFFARIVASLLGLVTTVGALAITFRYVPHIKGWSYPQVLMLVAMYYLMDGLIEMFIAPNMREIATKVREGTLDFVLLKPVNSQFMATFRSVNIWRAANLLVGTSLAAIAVRQLSVTMGWERAGLFAVTLAAGLGVIYSFWLVLVTLSFWFVRVDNIEQIVWQAFEAGRYPVEIYPGWLRATLTYVVPVALIITVPAQVLTGRLEPAFAGVAVLISAGAILASSLFWHFGLRYYTGASA